MSDGLPIAALSMINDMQRLTSISQNLTNAMTPGYKREMPVNAVFSSMISDKNLSMSIPEMSKVLDMKQGTLRYTGNPLDVAIESNGFFEIHRGEEVYYTRQGNFSLDAEGRLVTSSGDVVNFISGDLRLTTGQPSIDRDGRVMENGKQIGQIKIVHFDDPTLMHSVGEGKFVQSTATVKADGKVAVRQAHLEASNVNTAAEMVKMIETMRHFESGQKVIQMYDEMSERAISKLGEF